MNTQVCPKGPWHNPQLKAGVYEAVITSVEEGQYGLDQITVLTVLMWLPREATYFATNLYFPKSRTDSRSGPRLARLCSCVNRTYQEAWNFPERFRDTELRIQVKQYEGVNWPGQYCDVERFLSSESSEELVTENHRPAQIGGGVWNG